jgi:hypothetical protein
MAVRRKEEVGDGPVNASKSEHPGKKTCRRELENSEEAHFTIASYWCPVERVRHVIARRPICSSSTRLDKDHGPRFVIVQGRLAVAVALK